MNLNSTVAVQLRAIRTQGERRGRVNPSESDSHRMGERERESERERDGLKREPARPPKSSSTVYSCTVLTILSSTEVDNETEHRTAATYSWSVLIPQSRPRRHRTRQRGSLSCPRCSHEPSSVLPCLHHARPYPLRSKVSRRARPTCVLPLVSPLPLFCRDLVFASSFMPLARHFPASGTRWD